jgi:hypothetical protein
MTLGWQVLPEFRIVQHEKDKQILYEIKSYFGFGIVTKNHGDRMEFRVRGIDNLNKIVDFFENNPLKTSKQKNFEIFAKVIQKMNERIHLTDDGLKEIAELCYSMNRKIKPKYLESSETIRRNSSMMGKI